MSRRSTGRARPFALAVLLIAASCGGDDDSGADTSTAGPAPTTEVTAQSAEPEGPSGVIRVGAVADRMSFDPQLAEIGHQLQYLQPVYDTLLRETPDGELVPMLAQEWTYDEERTSLELRLRDDVRFIDGETFTAEAVKANLERGLTSTGPRASALANLESVEVVDETTAVLSLNAPDPMLLRELSSVMGMMVSPAALANTDLDVNPVGSGPYVFQPGESADGDTYVYTRNPEYWDPTLQGVERIEIVLLADENARLNALRAGQIDMAPGSAVQVLDAERDGFLVLRTAVDWMGFNLADRDGSIVPELADSRVRRAMNHAIDRQAIVDSVGFGMGAPATQIYPQVDPANIDPNGTLYPYDPDMARSLLTEAGYPNGLTISTPVTTFVAFAPVAEAVVGYLAEVGISVELNVSDVANTVIESWMDPQSPITHISFGARSANEMVRLFILDDGSFNPFATVADGARELLDEAVLLPDAEAVERYADIAELVSEEAWFLVTHSNDAIYFVGPRVQGVEMFPQQVVPSIYGWSVSD